jgi:hypothetical protein
VNIKQLVSWFFCFYLNQHKLRLEPFPCILITFFIIMKNKFYAVMVLHTRFEIISDHLFPPPISQRSTLRTWSSCLPTVYNTTLGTRMKLKQEQGSKPSSTQKSLIWGWQTGPLLHRSGPGCKADWLKLLGRIQAEPLQEFNWFCDKNNICYWILFFFFFTFILSGSHA